MEESRTSGLKPGARRHANCCVASRRREAVLATQGNLLALQLNALDPTFAYEFWRELSFPDIYQVVFSGREFRGVERPVGRCLTPISRRRAETMMSRRG